MCVYVSGVGGVKGGVLNSRIAYGGGQRLCVDFFCRYTAAYHRIIRNNKNCEGNLWFWFRGEFRDTIRYDTIGRWEDGKISRGVGGYLNGICRVKEG